MELEWNESAATTAPAAVRWGQRWPIKSVQNTAINRWGHLCVSVITVRRRSERLQPET